MIPLRLTLRNFMSYGDEPTTLDFEGLSLVCLSGDNGNGKSALLDAITYALWGETRASGSSATGEDDLVRLGAEDMEVRLDFRVDQDTYRALRRYSRRTRSGDWSVQIGGAGGEWRPIGGNTKRETQAHLQRILRMSYETFLNSAYLRQGRADEFTRQRPEKRKALLAEILELSRYDRLEELARGRQRQADEDLKEVQLEMRALEAVLAEEPRLREELAAAEASLQEWTAEKARRDEVAQRRQAEEAALNARQEALERRSERLRADRAELSREDAEVQRLQAAVRECTDLLAKRQEVEALLAELNAARSRVEQLRPMEEALAAARQRLAGAEGRLRLQEQELRARIQTAQREWQEAEKRAAQVRDLDARIAEADANLQKVAGVENELKAAQEQLQNVQHRFGELKAEADRLTADIAEIQESLEVLGQDRAVCPVCTSDLSGGKLERVIERQKQRLADAQKRLQEARAEGVRAKARRKELEEQIAGLEKREAELQSLAARAQEWRRQRDALLEQNARAGDTQAALAEARRRLEQNDYALEERAEIARLTEEIGSLSEVAAEAAAARQTVRRLTDERIEARHARILDAADRLEEHRASLNELNVRREQRRKGIAREEEQIRAEQEALAGLGAIREQARRAADALREADARLAEARGLVEVKKDRIAGCERARTDLAARQSKAARLQRDRQAYADLAAAMGKKGVQALIIENALPDVQDEANRLLARMTENSMQVQLVTQRAARSRGGAIETLDIRIQDDAGVRPYELFSGGEAFRVNFALRIALSRLLAHRAGASLQTLFLDEGFGTQDAKGQERLIEAIEAIRGEFALILVISHIEAMKDAFPARIEVVKTPQGSRILVGE